MSYHIETNFNSDGINYPSVSIYFHGCDKANKCSNCHNKELWEFDDSTIDIDTIIKECEIQINKISNFYDKVSLCFIGGEPLSPQYRKYVKDISKYFSINVNVISILYSWRTLEDIQKDKEISSCTKYINYGVLGSYEEKYKSNDFPASTNQIIYDFKKKQKINKEMMI